MESAELASDPSESRANSAAKVPPGSQQQQTHEVVPPYWQMHCRNESTLSTASLHLRPSGIVLEDHTEEQCEQSKALWAREVTIDDYTVVSGSAPGIGAYVVWNCTVETLNVSYTFSTRKLEPRICINHAQGGPMKIRKRYRNPNAYQAAFI